MRYAWLDLAFTRFRYLTDFKQATSVIVVSSEYQRIYKHNTSFRTTDNFIASSNKLPSLIKMTKWHAQVVHMAEHMNMVADPL